MEHCGTLWRQAHPSTYDARMNSPLLHASDLPLDPQGVASAYAALDASILLPGQTGDFDQEFRNRHLSGARRFDIDVFSDPDSPLPHTVPGAARFARLMGELGLSEEVPLLFYDQRGSVGACRGWWLARLFGHRNVRILDGGLEAWMEAGGVPEQGESEPARRAIYRPRPTYGLLAGIGDVAQVVQTGHGIVLDARSAARFAARVPEPRPGVRGGHMPGAINLDWTRLMNGQGRFLPAEQLRTLFPAADGQRVIASCGSGLTAATLLAGLEAAGLPSGALFDGSWAEWGADASVPVVTGDV